MTDSARSGEGRFPHLTTPGRIGSLELRNRMVMCPMGVLFGNEDGSVSDNEAAFYEARARGGVGLMIIGTACVAYPRGTNHERMPAVSDDKYLPGMTDLAARVHKHGGRVAAQLNYMGVYSYLDMLAGRKRLVPYVPALPRPDHVSAMVTPQEMAEMAGPFTAAGTELGYQVADEADIAWVIERYVEAADRCRRAGYDGVELHAGHGYFIDEFLSPRNNRTDRWGGDIEGRARLLVEVIHGIRNRLGREFPVWMRINAVERHHHVGEQFEEQCRAIELAVDAGIDAVHLTSYANTDVAQAATDSYAPHVVGPLSDYAAAVRRVVNVPVITFGRFEPDEAEAVLADGKADFVAMGRKLLADPDLPNKVTSGRVDDVRPCIYQYKCIGNIALRTPARCVVNPVTGREHDLRIEPTSSTRSVLVVGGGPAGLEAARLLAERGHRVILREATTRLGGMLIDAAVADPLLDTYLGWLIRQVERADIALELGRPVTAGDIPDGIDDVVVATGAVWGTPDIPVDGNRLQSLGDISTWLHVDGDAVGTDVVILGESKAALSVAELCHRRGRKPTVVAGHGYLAAELGLPGRYRMISELEAAGVRLLTNTAVDHISDEGVHITQNGTPDILTADTVIGITPARPATTLALDGLPVHTIGDCHEVAFLEGATNSALTVARSIG
jgi:2,4-dienoyl-CoA reductase (NADPH2)